jgi:hypothetical protein
MPEPGDRMINIVANGKIASNIWRCGVVRGIHEWPRTATSGVYLHGLYETQIRDSFGIVPLLDIDRRGANQFGEPAYRPPWRLPSV